MTRLVCTNTLFCQFVFLFVANFRLTNALVGLISPIEVVEEWGCYDSEIRLTCGHLDSRIAILEATFAPNCTGDTRGACEWINGKLLTRAFLLLPKSDQNRAAENEAGRRFLETLRRSNDVEDANYELVEDSEVMADEEQEAELISSRTALKASLERMIVEYLGHLTPGQETNEVGDDQEAMLANRVRRDMNNNVNGDANDDDGDGDDGNDDDDDDDADAGANLTILATHQQNETAAEVNAEAESGSGSVDIVSVPTFATVATGSDGSRVELGVRNITVAENGQYREHHRSPGRRKKVKSGVPVCRARRTRVAQLDRFEMERALADETDHEHNIRAILSHRCSGKNHCSFVFASDHPFSIVWETGIVHIKYICMNEFRVNQYCGEHLAIGNEILVPPSVDQRHHQQQQQAVTVKGEPVAEARIQSDQKFHQFTNLKILKSKPDDEVAPTTEGLAQRKEERRRQRIYSQDFTRLKVLPKNLEDFNDIEKIVDEFFFKNDDITVLSTEAPSPNVDDNADTKDSDTAGDVEDNEIVPDDVTEGGIVVIPHFNTEVDVTPIPVDENQIGTAAVGGTTKRPRLPANRRLGGVTPKTGTGIEMIIREGETIVSRFDGPLWKAPASTTKATVFWKSRLHEIEDDEIMVAPTNQTEIERITSNTTNDVSNEIDEMMVEGLATTPKRSEKLLDDTSVIENVRNEVTVHRQNVVTTKSGNDDEAQDYSEEDYDYRIGDGAKRYTSITRTAMRKPLLQGFVMTPGYPKFYIGESECRWTISAPEGQKIRIAFLDIHLRYDSKCRDFVQVVDVGIHRPLFNSCSENPRPLEIISDSSKLEITVKTTTKMMYPKRGVLFHYTALGCLTPPTPLHAKLVHRGEKRLNYICDTAYVFPDTAAESRELHCVGSTWDRQLPNCIEESAVDGSGVVATFDLNRNESAMQKAAMSTMSDIVVPTLLIVGLFIVNAGVCVVIMLFRKKNQFRVEAEQREMAIL